MDDVGMFIEWGEKNGYHPGLEIDRRNNDREYSPENCRFVTRKVNNRNKRTSRFVTAMGQTKTIAEWLEDPQTAVSEGTLRRRIGKLKWDSERAITTPADMRFSYW